MDLGFKTMLKNILSLRFLRNNKKILNIVYNTRIGFPFRWLWAFLKLADSKNRIVILESRVDGLNNYLSPENQALLNYNTLNNVNIFDVKFENHNHVYLRYCSEHLEDVLNIIPLLKSLSLEYPSVTLFTNHHRFPFHAISEKCFSAPDMQGGFPHHANFFDFTGLIRKDLYCPAWMQFFVFLDREPTPFLENPFPLLVETDRLKTELAGTPYVVVNVNAERSNLHEQQQINASVGKVLELLHVKGFHTVEISDNLPLLHLDSTFFFKKQTWFDLFTLIKHSAGFVGVDSVPLRVASLYGKPILGYFDNNHPLNSLPTMIPAVHLVIDHRSLTGDHKDGKQMIQPAGPVMHSSAQKKGLIFDANHVQDAARVFVGWLLQKDYFQQSMADVVAYYTDSCYQMARREFCMGYLLSLLAKDPNALTSSVLLERFDGPVKAILRKFTDRPRFLNNYEEIEQYLKKREIDKILISYFGGIGDTLLLFWLALAIRRQFPNAYLFIIPSGQHVAFLKDCLKFMNHIFVIDLDHQYMEEYINAREKMFDLILDCRYVTKVTSTNQKYDKYARNLQAVFEQYNINFDRSPLDNYLHREHGLDIFSIIQKTSGIHLQHYDATFPLSPDDFHHLQDLLDDPYVTIGAGVDPYWNEQSSSPRKTKQWPVEYWQNVIDNLNTLGVRVVQLGNSYEKPLAHTIGLLGKTSVREAAAVIKYALCHISIEGGLVWVAKSVGTPSIVLFGPTDPGFFGQPHNINLTAALPCSPCWWKTDRWMEVCPEGHETSRCMEELTPEMVFKEVKKIVDDYKNPKSCRLSLLDISFFDHKLVADNLIVIKELGDNAALPVDQLYKSVQNGASGIYLHGSKYWEYTYALKNIEACNMNADAKLKIVDVGSGRGAIHKTLLQRGYDVTVADVNFAFAGEQWESKFLSHAPVNLTVAFNSIFNLSFPSESFDVVLCLSVIEHVKGKAYAFRELLRVLKDGGILIITFDFVPQQVWDEDVNDIFGKYSRVEVFNEKSICELLSNFKIQGQYSEAKLMETYAASSDNIQISGVEGIPPKMTVGGLVIKKQAV